MSYLEYSVKSVPSGFRKILFLNWPLILLLFSVAGVGFLMLYSVAGGSFSIWAEPQAKRFAMGLIVMLVAAMIPIWFWRNIYRNLHCKHQRYCICVRRCGVFPRHCWQ